MEPTDRPNSRAVERKYIRWLVWPTAFLALLAILIQWGSRQSPQEFLESEGQRLEEQLGQHKKDFNDWVSLCEDDRYSETNRWGNAAQQVGMPDWQLQVFWKDSLVYWSQGRLTASEDATSGFGWMRLPRQICWRFDTLVGTHRYRFTRPLLVYQSGNWRFCDANGRVLPGSEAVEWLWNGNPSDNRPWYSCQLANGALESSPKLKPSLKKDRSKGRFIGEPLIRKQ